MPQQIQIRVSKTDENLWKYINTTVQHLNVSQAHFIAQCAEFYWFQGIRLVQHYEWRSEWQSGASEGWSFVVGSEENLKELLEQVRGAILTNARPLTRKNDRVREVIQVYRSEETDDLWNFVDEEAENHNLTLSLATTRAMRFYWFLENFQDMKSNRVIQKDKEVRVYSVSADLDVEVPTVSFFG